MLSLSKEMESYKEREVATTAESMNIVAHCGFYLFLFTMFSSFPHSHSKLVNKGLWSRIARPEVRSELYENIGQEYDSVYSYQFSRKVAYRNNFHATHVTSTHKLIWLFVSLLLDPCIQE